jgi:hypothetical protein
MWILVGLIFPLLLLLLVIGMERVERPLRDEDVTVQLRSSLESARPDELESLVSRGFAPALDRYWRRRRLPRSAARRRSQRVSQSRA